MHFFHVCVCVCVCAAVPTSSQPVPSRLSSLLPGSLPATSSYLQDNHVAMTTGPTAGATTEFLSVSNNAHVRQPSDSGSVGSTGSSARFNLNGSPQHVQSSHGYSLLTQSHADGLPPRGRSNTTASTTGLAHQPMRRLKSPQDIKSRPVSARRSSRHVDTHPAGMRKGESVWAV